MTDTNARNVRGWCPGALNPMESGDGLIVRLRAHAGMLSADDLLAISGIAQRYGNGLIDLTRRAKIQVRGVMHESLTNLWSELSGLRLLDSSAGAEAVRNIMVSPLAGIDPTELCDARPIARKLEHRLCSDKTLWQLPGKFGFIVDGGGRLPLDDERADIRLKSTRATGETKVAIGIDYPEGTTWLGVSNPDTAAEAAARVALAFLNLPRTDARSRMRDLTKTARIQLQEATAAQLESMHELRPHQHRLSDLGVLDHNGGVIAAGIAAPFGRIEATALRTFVHAAISLNVTDFRISPWRSLYASVSDERTAKSLVEAAETQTFIIDDNDPQLAIDACPGAPACRSTMLDTRAVARQLAPLIGDLGCRCIHVSGCSKGCARSKPADLVLVGTEDRFGVVRNGTAQDDVCVLVEPDDLTPLPDILRTI